jgi:hypothetical protein
VIKFRNKIARSYGFFRHVSNAVLIFISYIAPASRFVTQCVLLSSSA